VPLSAAFQAAQSQLDRAPKSSAPPSIYVDGLLQPGGLTTSRVEVDSEGLRSMNATSVESQRITGPL
jgi:hypothetical protein